MIVFFEGLVKSLLKIVGLTGEASIRQVFDLLSRRLCCFIRIVVRLLVLVLMLSMLGRLQRLR